MNKRLKLLLVLSLVATAIVPSYGVALADDNRNEGVLRPDLGPVVEGMTPGVDGYKIFGPNAIATQSKQRRGMTDGLLEETRWGGSDIWHQGGVPDMMRASHTSTSTINEDEIWVDGAIKISTQGWYMNGDPSHTSGMFANTNTEMPNPGALQLFIAHSWHHFYDYTWEEWNVETEDSIVY